MNFNEAILCGIIAVSVVSGLTFWGYKTSECKIEAIKAGMKSEEVSKACH